MNLKENYSYHTTTNNFFGFEKKNHSLIFKLNLISGKY